MISDFISYQIILVACFICCLCGQVTNERFAWCVCQWHAKAVGQSRRLDILSVLSSCRVSLLHLAIALSTKYVFAPCSTFTVFLLTYTSKWLGSLTVTCRTCNPEVSQRRRFDSTPGHCRVTTLGKLFTHVCLCH